jgi:hypothetical protein
MASSTGHPGAVSRETYWKRRAFVLVGMMLVFAVIAFACRPSAGEDGEPSRSEAGAGASEEPSPSVPPEEPSDAESPSPEEDEDAEAGEDAEGSGEGGAEGEGDEEEGGSGSGSGSGGGSGDVAAPERPEDPCRPQDVVVTFDFAQDKETYGAGEEPGFRVTVVNTAEQVCTVDVGAEAMELRIHSGDDRVFSTADCVSGSSAEERQLRRGVPHEFTITWDRMRSFTDCRDDTRAAGAGWYRANLHGDYVGDTEQLAFQIKA